MIQNPTARKRLTVLLLCCMSGCRVAAPFPDQVGVARISPSACIVLSYRTSESRAPDTLRLLEGSGRIRFPDDLANNVYRTAERTFYGSWEQMAWWRSVTGDSIDFVVDTWPINVRARLPREGRRLIGRVQFLGDAGESWSGDGEVEAISVSCAGIAQSAR
jgi:hypothetical protein